MSELSDTINNFSTLFDNPALGGVPSINSKVASELLSILGSLVDSGEDATYFAGIIESLALGGRKPSRREWVALRGEAQVVEEEPVEEEPPVVAQEEPEAEQVPETGEAEASGDEPTSEEPQPE